MNRFLAIDAFVRVAETCSFAEAARRMRVSRSVVTERIRQLEELVGAPLFYRNTRSVRLSELGQAFLRDCTDLVGRSNEVVDQMRGETTSPAGRLRVHALPGFVLGHLPRVLRDFQVRYPRIELEMIVNDTVIDPVREGFDCALQIFPPGSEGLVSRKLFPVRRVLCATEEYLACHGPPGEPSQLVDHRLGWYSGYPTRERLTFHGSGTSVSVDLKPALLTNSVHLLLGYALEHGGIVCVPTLVASDALLSGTLQLVLPEYQLTSFWLSVFYAPSVRGALKLKLFLEALVGSFPSTPPWDEKLLERGFISKAVIDS